MNSSNAPAASALVRDRRFGLLVAVAVVGLALWAVGLAFDVRGTLFAYVVAFSYWAGIVLAGLILLLIWHATHARWPVVVRRPLEALAAATPILFLLFLPIALGLRQIYSWVAPDPNAGAEALHLLAQKRPYLNPVFFFVRTAFYLAFASFVASRLFGWSVRQDGVEAAGRVGAPDEPVSLPALALTRRQRRLGTGTLPFMALAFAFASFDWLMSLTPLWFSTIFGVYYFAGSLLGAIALLTIVVANAQGTELGRAVTVEHLHNLGKLLLAFICFWAYIAFSQLLLIWIANLPEEVPFYFDRLRTPWRPLGFALLFVQFVLPFAAFLSRELKRRRRALSLAAGWVMLAHLLDLYWLVMPTLDPKRVVFPLSLLPAFVGVGAAVLAFVVFLLRGRSLIPLRDPYLAESLRFQQP